MGRRGWAVLAVLCGAIFLEGVDVAMLNVALPSIRTDLDLSSGSLHWVVSAYVLGYGGFMLLGGRAADLLGRRRMFVVPLAVFVAFSGLGGIATEGWTLILARLVTGVAAAFMTPAGLSIITTSFAEGPARNRALLVYAGTASGGFSLGLVVGGLLTTVSWRWVFFAPVLLALVILVAALALLERDEAEPKDARGRIDVAGAVTITGAMVLAIFTLTELERRDGRWGLIVASGVTSVVLAGVFFVAERRSSAPLVRLELLARGSLVRTNVSALLFMAGFFAFQFVVTLYLQDLRGWSSIATSLALLVVGIDAVLAPTLTPRLVARFGTGRVILGGLGLAAVAYGQFLRVEDDWAYASMFPSIAVLGLAFALVYGPLTIAATDGVDEDEQGVASGVLYTAMQFGAALGLAAVTVARGEVGPDTGAPELLDGFRTALLVPLVAVVLASAVIASGLVGRRRTDGSREPATR
ncbi:MFS transporter [Iamia sp. SCSIO 61187]|uniref:MFS transporter n=1 Tax=Iamia sp. SCSIO 61187 TaxID=2722752 RepID=UPI00351D2F73